MKNTYVLTFNIHPKTNKNLVAIATPLKRSKNYLLLFDFLWL